MTRSYLRLLPSAAPLIVGALLLVPRLSLPSASEGAEIDAKLSEWKIELSETTLARGSVTLTVANTGSIPHQLEIEGHGIERRTGLIQPGASATLEVMLVPGTYEIYCPVGDESHKKLGMETHLAVTATPATEQSYGGKIGEGDAKSAKIGTRTMRLSGGGPVIKILPGP